MNSRIEIERALLGAIIFCNAYAQVAHIINEKNFTSTSEIKNREVFGVIKKMFPVVPIDMITVLKQLSESYPDEEVGDWVFCCDGYVQSSQNAGYWALMLLQIDVTEKYKDVLIEWRDARVMDLDKVEAAVLTEMLEEMKRGIDIFDFISKSIQYFDLQKMDRERDAATFFNDSFDVRIKSIKQANTMKCILNNLFSMCKTVPEHVIQCEIFAKAIVDITSTGMTNDRYVKAVSIIYN